MADPRLSPLQLGQLVPHVSGIIRWLRSVETHAGDLFVDDEPASSRDNNSDDVLAAMLEHLNSSGNFTLRELRDMCAQHGAVAVAAAVRRVLLDCEPRLICESVADGLLAAMPALEDAVTEEECALIIGPLLDDMPLPHRDALAVFCALARDTCTESASLAVLCGPQLLLSSNTRARSRSRSDSSASNNTALDNHANVVKASALMDLLVSESELIFGVCAVRTGVENHFGLRDMDDWQRVEIEKPISNVEHNRRKNQHTQQQSNRRRKKGTHSDTDNDRKELGRSEADVDGDSSVLVNNPLTHTTTDANDISNPAWCVKQLRAFYQWHDPSRVDGAEKLFQVHSFENIAQALLQRYGTMPPSFQMQLSMQARSGVAGLDWFTQANVGAGETRLRRPSDRNRGGASNGASSISTSTTPVGKRCAIDLIIDEICDSEHRYNEILRIVVEVYVKRLRNAATGHHGKDVRKALGMSIEQVEAVFGWRLEAVLALSNQLLASLEVVDLVRTSPTNSSRIELVSQALLAITSELHVYTPFVSSQRAGLRILGESMKGASSVGSPNGSKRRLKKIGSLGRGFSKSSSLLSSAPLKTDADGLPMAEIPLHFIRLWDAVTASSRILFGQTLQSILIMPVQRVPRYRLLLKELAKELPVDDPAYPILQEAMEAVGAWAKYTNDALRKHEKLEKILGAKEMQSHAKETEAGARNSDENLTRRERKKAVDKLSLSSSVSSSQQSRDSAVTNGSGRTSGASNGSRGSGGTNSRFAVD